MNNTFSWNRFCRLVAKDCRSLWPLFGTTMLILAVLPIAAWLLMMVFFPEKAIAPSVRLVMIEAVAVLAAIMTPSRLYRTWNLRDEGIYFAMLPASKLEKFCSAVLFSAVVCPLLVYCGGVLLDLLLTLLPIGPYREWLWQSSMGFPFTLDLAPLATIDSDATAIAAVGPVFVLALVLQYLCNVFLFLFTSTLFRRHKVLKTYLWVFLIEFVFSIVVAPLTMLFVGDGSWLEYADPEKVVLWSMWLAVVVNGGLAILFGWLGWRRLKRMAY